MTPQVTVLMAVHNGECFLREAIDSILSQTLSDFEFIVVDDGSQDGTPDILAQVRDARLRVLRHDRNRGQTAALNTGLASAGGKYIARLDADDIALPNRLEKQVAFLYQHPEIGLLGSACWLIDPDGQDIGVWSRPMDDLNIRWISLLANPFAHPTVMIRRDVLVRNGLSYDETFQVSQDYDLWTRMLRFTCGANLSEPLVQYRVHDQNSTSRRRAIMLQEHDAIALRTICEQLPDFPITPKQISQLRALFVGGSEFTPGLDTQRVVLAHLYLDLFEAFIGQYREKPDLKALRHQETLRVIRLVLRPPLRPGWMNLVGRLITIDPSLPWSFVDYASKALGRRMGRRARGFLRAAG